LRRNPKDSKPKKVLESVCDESASFFISTHNETLSIAAMCVSNKDCLRVATHSCNTAQLHTVKMEAESGSLA